MTNYQKREKIKKKKRHKKKARDTINFDQPSEKYTYSLDSFLFFQRDDVFPGGYYQPIPYLSKEENNYLKQVFLNDNKRFILTLKELKEGVLLQQNHKSPPPRLTDFDTFVNAPYNNTINHANNHKGLQGKVEPFITYVPNRSQQPPLRLSDYKQKQSVNPFDNNYFGKIDDIILGKDVLSNNDYLFDEDSATIEVIKDVRPQDENKTIQKDNDKNRFVIRKRGEIFKKK